ELETLALGKGGTFAVIYSADGQSLIIDAVPNPNRPEVFVWDLRRNTVSRSVLASGGQRTLALARDGSVLAIGRRDRLTLWSRVSGPTIETWKLPLRYVIRDVAFAPDSRHIATANENGTVLIFRLAGVR